MGRLFPEYWTAEAALQETLSDKQQGKLRSGVDAKPRIDMFKVGTSGPPRDARACGDGSAGQARSVPPCQLPLLWRQLQCHRTTHVLEPDKGERGACSRGSQRLT
jgi:hypothetical protein